MTILLREDILSLMRRDRVEERLIVTPLLDPQHVGPGTIDLRLGTEFIEVLRRAETVIDPFEVGRGTSEVTPSSEESLFVPLGEHFVLHPGQFVLGATLEYVRLPADVGGQVLSRSSWGRLGLIVATAVVVQPGFAGMLTLELVNAGTVPIHLYPGLRVAQLQLWLAERPAGAPYGVGEGKYRAPVGPQSHRLAWEGDELRRIRRIGLRLGGSD